MTVPNRGRRAVALLSGLLAVAAPAAWSQAAGASDKTPPAATKAAPPQPQRKLAVGLRISALPAKSLSSMDNGQLMSTTTASRVNYDWNYNTTGRSMLLGGGAAVEATLSNRSLLTFEVLFRRVGYDRTTDEYWGTDDPTTAADERSHWTSTENTRARVFDVPVLLHRNFRAEGFLSHLYWAGGGTVRLVSTVHTTNNITASDGAKSTNTIAAPINKRTVYGGTVGIGFRFIDEFHIKVTPEIRYTRWVGTTFNNTSTISPANQFEISVGLTR